MSNPKKSEKPEPSGTKPKLTPAQEKDKIEIAFRVSDENKDGYLDRKEFAQLAKNLPKERMEMVFDKVDKNHDGVIDYSEFKHMMETHKKK